MSAVTLSCCTRPIQEFLFLPFNSVYSVALRVLSALAKMLKNASIARSLCLRAIQIENKIDTLCKGLMLYGRRLLISVDNHAKTWEGDLEEYQRKGFCRGASLSFILEALQRPEKPLIEIAKRFENQMPDVAVRFQERSPEGLIEESFRLYDENTIIDPKNFSEGAYTFSIALFGQDVEIKQAHRVAFIKRGEDSYLFDPAIGLIRYETEDWPKILKGEFAEGAFKVIFCFRYFLMR